MEIIVKHFNELTASELHEIYKLRIAVFVVEQNCAYQDVDDADKAAYHLYLKDEEGIQSYVRVLPQGALHETASIGRVISIKRRCGLATQLLKSGIELAKEKFGARELTVGAQKYARGLYEKVGFVQCSEEYIEDGIVHIKMKLTIE